MNVTSNNLNGGFIEGLGVVVATFFVGIAAQIIADAVGLTPKIWVGVTSGAILGVYVWSLSRKALNASSLVDATSRDRIEFDEPRAARVTSPPYDAKEYDVFAIETNPDGDYPFKVWVEDGNGKNKHPFYASGVEFEK